MEEKNSYSEIISVNKVETQTPHKVKLKIKERVSRRKRKKLNPFIKIIVFLVSCYLGFYFGWRLVGKYFSYFRSKTQISFPEEEAGVSYQLKPGEIFSPAP